MVRILKSIKFFISRKMVGGRENQSTIFSLFPPFFGGWGQVTQFFYLSAKTPLKNSPNPSKVIGKVSELYDNFLKYPPLHLTT